MESTYKNNVKTSENFVCEYNNIITILITGNKRTVKLSDLILFIIIIYFVLNVKKWFKPLTRA